MSSARDGVRDHADPVAAPPRPAAGPATPVAVPEVVVVVLAARVGRAAGTH